MQRPFRRLAVVNRGEAAVRVIRAVRELNDGLDDPVRLIALHTDPESGARFVRESDESVRLGPATFTDPRDGLRKNGYLDRAALERALVEARADAVWVGWGFVAEDPDFVGLCDRLGIVFVGPSASAMRTLGDKIGSKRLAEEAGVPVAPWSGGPVDTVDEARACAATMGYPLMIKATAGGGGRGIRRVDHPADLDEAFTSARSEASAAFGDPTVFLEQVVSPARHVEVQVIADGAGAAWAVGVRDCSLQRRNQKVVEESGCPVLTPDEDRQVREFAVQLAVRSGYVNAGTVEFLFQPETRALSFMEVNARLQVEHPVTEMTTGLDLVKLQLHVAAGGRLEGTPPPGVGHAVEARVNAEDPARDFLPAPGPIELLRLPGGPGVRVDAGVAEGDVVPAEFDSMIAKVVAWGADRDEALARLRRALSEMAVVICGGATNRGFLLDLLDRPAVRTGVFDNGWLDREQAVHGFAPSRHADLALVQAAIDVADAEELVDQQRFYGSARRGRPQASGQVGREVDLRLGGQPYHLVVWRMGPRRWRVAVDDAVVDAGVDRLGPHEARLSVDGTARSVVSSRHGGDLVVEVDGVAHRVSLDDAGLVRSPAPAVVVALRVAVGDRVAAGDAVAVIESMKTETLLTAPVGGRVREVLVGTNVQVDTGTPLMLIEPSGPVADDGDRPRVVVHQEPPAPVTTTTAALARLRADQQLLEWLMLGFDVPDDEVDRIVGGRAALVELVGAGHPEVLEGEHRLLRLHATLCSLTRPQHRRDDIGEAVRSPAEHFHAYLRSLDASREGLPGWFVGLLEQVALAHGLDGLDPGDELADAMYRLFRSLQRPEPRRGVVLGVLARRLDDADELVGSVPAEFREVLDQLVTATRSRDPVVAERAQLVRHRYFDQALLEAVRDVTYAEMEGVLDRLVRDGTPGPARDVAVERLVACPQALAPLLTARLAGAAPHDRGLLLEVMARRYYRMRELSPFRTESVDGVELRVSEYVHHGTRHHVVVAEADLDQPAAVLAAVASWSASVPAGDTVLVDLYGERAGGTDPDTFADRLTAEVAAVTCPEGMERIVVAATRRGGGPGMSAVDLFTFRRDAGGGCVEDRRIRGLHPMMALRLQLWRLANFDIERLPCAEDVHLFRGVAFDNPKDERLFAVAEVRDLTPVRDEAGRLVALPELERMLDEAFDGIRRYQVRLAAERRLMWNRVLLYLWPPLLHDVEELRGIIGRLARGTDALGMEMVVVRCRMPDPGGDGLVDRVIRVSNPGGSGLLIEVDDPPTRPLEPLDEYTRKALQARRRGAVYPYELLDWLTPAAPGRPGVDPGEFVEHDLDDEGRLVPVQRPPGQNVAGVVVGILRSHSTRYPEGMSRVVLLGDPTKALGSIAEPECRRIIAALDLAAATGLPVDWFALSAGARIAMDSGTENMDWVASVLRRIIEFTQAGGEVNVVVTGINVGAQPYWNAEATMLMHTRGILVMTPRSAMVLTGKQALEYSGAVSAEDNFGIGGYERIMGPNGQAQYWAADLAEACRILNAHHDHAYVAPGERFPRRAHTADPLERDVGASPHRAPDSEFSRVGDIFSPDTNPERKKSFDVRAVMHATVDQDHPTLERWSGMAGAETGVVWDAHLGGWPVTLVGIESRPLQRFGPVPADGPDHWTAGTLFPLSSKKIARAINATSGARPLVVLANLSGFDGSPESMRRLQLEFGAEIGRAVVNFDGPIVFCVISRFHGGAFVVFSRRLNDDLEALAVEGSHASVIGGAPAAAVVFTHEVDVRTRQDPRVADLEARLAGATGEERERLRAEVGEVRSAVRAEKRGELAAEFDAIHSVERALAVGSIDRIIPSAELRPALVAAIDRGVQRVLDRLGRER